MAQRAISVPRRRWPVVVALVALAVFVAFSFLSSFYVDVLWFREVGYSTVFWTQLWTKIGLGTCFGILFFVLLWVNLVIVRRIAPRYRALSPEQEMIERYRLAFEPLLKWLIPLFAGLLALVVGLAAAKEWQTFLLWRNASGATFGLPDPLFHRDASFYVFRLPFLKFIQGWLFSALVGVTIIVTIAHYLWGGIRPQGPGERVTPQVKAHLSVLLGLIMLVKAWGYWLGRFDLLTSPRGVVTGASYTDVKAQLPALNILTIVAVLCAVLFLVNIRLRGWAFPVIGIALLGLVSAVVGALIPTAVQSFSVEPQELQRERPYIARNIEFTRKAYGLDTITSSNVDVVADLPPETVAENATTVSNIRLWDPALLQQDYQQLQRLKQYYEFQDVDVDRYMLDGEERVVMMSAREISQEGIPSGGGTWQNKHLVYTHGYGAAASQVNAVSDQGGPLFVLSDIPPLGNPDAPGSEELAAQLNAGQPRVYYGERSDVAFTVVDTKARELDYQGSDTSEQTQVTTVYHGSGGIPVGSTFRKALFAWRFRDPNLLISSLIGDKSRVMIYRSIQERVPRAAPFLKLDGDPYAAVVDGRIQWIWDAYTTTNDFPYSQRLRTQDVVSAPPNGPGGTLSGSVNYIRNSVKVVVDAYTGSITYYLVDPDDPIAQVWDKALPGLLTPVSEASPDLVAHFRYPENLLQVQATQFANYHVVDPEVFYQKQDFWQIPPDPPESANSGAAVPLRPYYVLMLLPGETKEEFALILPFTPEKRQNMVAWMAAKSDPADYGEVVTFEFPAGRNVDGPVQVFNQIQSFPEFSAQQTLLGQGGSQLRFGNFLVVPMGNSFMYVQPIFVESAQEDSFPELKRVVVSHGGAIGIGPSLEEAIADSYGVEVQPPGEAPPSGGSGGQGGGRSVDALLAKALEHFQAADEALKAGDLAAYQREIELARALIRQAGALSLKDGGGGTKLELPSPGPGSSEAPPAPSGSPGSPPASPGAT